MRALLLLAMMLCAVFGSLLLLEAPAFFMPSRDPAIGLQFDASSSRLLGAGLLALALAGTQYLPALYRKRAAALASSRRAQQRYALTLLLALALLAGALMLGTAGPNPDYRAPTGQR